jgi:integrase
MKNELIISPALPRDGATLPSNVTAVLTPQDSETLSHLLRQGIGANTLRATRSDLAYLEAWSLACDGSPLPWPPSPEIVLRFIAHHLWDPDMKAMDPSHGMPGHVREALTGAKFLQVDGPHAPATVERRISSWRSLCKWRSVDHPFTSPEVSRTLRAAIRASSRPKQRKSKRNVDIEMMEELLDHLDTISSHGPGGTREQNTEYLRGVRDRSILSMMFASGGRRRSEISDLMHGQITRLEPIQADSEDWPEGIPSMGLRLGRTKTTDVRDTSNVFLTGRAVQAFDAWHTAVPRKSGPVFLRIGRWGEIFETSISPHAVNEVLKKRLVEIGYDRADFSAHGVRAGYITSALKAGIPAPEVMEQTLHRSLDTLMGYFKDEAQREGRAARLL